MLTRSSFLKFMQFVESQVAKDDDTVAEKRMKCFQWMTFVSGLITCASLLPFSIWIADFPACHALSCLWLPCLCVLPCTITTGLIILTQWKSVVWPRRICMCNLIFFEIMMHLSHGGYEWGSPTMALAAFAMMVSLNVYDDIATPAKWMAATTLHLILLGFYELMWDPYRGYTYHREVLVLEQWFLTLSCGPLSFGIVALLKFYLKEEAEKRKATESKSQ